MPWPITRHPFGTGGCIVYGKAEMRTLLLLLVVNVCWAQPEITLQTTPDGIRFGILGKLPDRPLPVLIYFTTSLEGSLQNPDYAKLGWMLAANGFLVVSLDVPCHGLDKGPERNELSCWARRLENGDDFLKAFTSRVSKVLTHLVEKGHADPSRVIAAGVSRGGFIASHVAAGDARVSGLVALAPVTDLLELREFENLSTLPLANRIALNRIADGLAGRAVFIWIGNHDTRVGTDACLSFARALVQASIAAGRKADVELHMVPSEGHRSNESTYSEAAGWISTRYSGASVVKTERDRH